jgi:hypothetical protein
VKGIWPDQIRSIRSPSPGSFFLVALVLYARIGRGMLCRSTDWDIGERGVVNRERLLLLPRPSLSLSLALSVSVVFET